MNRLIYLVQGRSDLVETYFHLADRENADALFLTYDKEIENAIFFPNSKWSEGRNKLLEIAKNKGEYDYYIFCDDDISFKRGSWDEFEFLLLKYRPAIAHPLFIPKAAKTPLPYLEKQPFCVSDQQFMAYHRDLISDGLIIPYQSDLDDFSWWVSGGVVNLIIKNFYSLNTLQFNNIKVKNTQTGRYEGTNNRKSYEYTINWFSKECKNGFKKFLRAGKFNNKEKFKLGLQTLLYYLLVKRSPDYRIKREKFAKIFKEDSVFLKQYDQINSST